MNLYEQITKKMADAVLEQEQEAKRVTTFYKKRVAQMKQTIKNVVYSEEYCEKILALEKRLDLYAKSLSDDFAVVLNFNIYWDKKSETIDHAAYFEVKQCDKFIFKMDFESIEGFYPHKHRIDTLYSEDYLRNNMYSFCKKTGCASILEKKQSFLDTIEYLKNSGQNIEITHFANGDFYVLFNEKGCLFQKNSGTDYNHAYFFADLFKVKKDRNTTFIKFVQF